MNGHAVSKSNETGASGVCHQSIARRFSLFIPLCRGLHGSQPCAGFKLAHGGGEVTRAAPLLSEHCDEVLAEAGYSEAEVAEMHDSGVV